MEFSSLEGHVCMESSDHWLQDESGILLDSSSSSPPTLLERSTRLRPPQDQALKCPRCESTHTKFCYYNNYSLSQPRYFCKTCRRYWTKGGTLRNIPVGGGCRKNKKPSSKKSPSPNDVVLTTTTHPEPKGLPFGGVSVMGNNINGMADMNGHNGFMATDFQGFGGNYMCYYDGYNTNSSGCSNNSGGGGIYNIMDSSFQHRPMMLPYDACSGHQSVAAIHDNDEVKPNPKLLALEWQDQGCSDAGKDSSFGYINGLGSWPGMINGYGPSTTNPLV